MNKHNEIRRTPDTHLNKKKRLRLLFLFLAIVLVVAVVIWAMPYLRTFKSRDTRNSLFEEKIVSLSKSVFSDEQILSLDPAANGYYQVFFSVSDGDTQAHVVHGKGQTLAQAWDIAGAAVRKTIDRQGILPVWLKVDVVLDSVSVSRDVAESRIKACSEGFFLDGISFEDDASTAFLETELNFNELIDYANNKLDLGAINTYLESNHRKAVKAVPETVTLFRVKGWLCDENGEIIPLDSEKDYYGQRQLISITDSIAFEVLSAASDKLVSMSREDGSFIYGYRLNTGKELTDYNILRHAGTIWNLVSLYKLTGDPDLPLVIERSLNYLKEDFVEYADSDTAFVIERKNNEIKLGGNALAVIALAAASEINKNPQDLELAIKLGNGILELMDEKTGQYWHVLNFPGYTRKEEFRTIYYDGEATFALTLLYKLTGDEKWLNAAALAVDRFIAQDYTQYADHWIAYAMNEITQYIPRQDYFEFALRNAGDNLEAIRNRVTAWHTSLELLLVTYELYDRIVSEGISVDYLDDFNEKAFLEIIDYRIKYTLGSFGWPEYVMYFSNPAQAQDGVFIRNDRGRMRIDDIQHFAGGYLKYFQNYKRLVR